MYYQNRTTPLYALTFIYNYFQFIIVAVNFFVYLDFQKCSDDFRKLPKIFRRHPNIDEGISKTSEGCRRRLKLSEDCKKRKELHSQTANETVKQRLFFLLKVLTKKRSMNKQSVCVRLMFSIRSRGYNKRFVLY